MTCTCPSNPEQYEVVDHKGDEIAYLRLRFGLFTATVPDPLGVEVYERFFDGDDWKGSFDTDEERRAEIGKAIDAVDSWYRAAAHDERGVLT